MREYIEKGIIGTLAPLSAFVVSLLDNIKECLQIVSLLAAIGVAIWSILSIREQRRLTRELMRKTVTEEAIIESELCAQCKAGNPPPVCPLGYKPTKCPYNNTIK